MRHMLREFLKDEERAPTLMVIASVVIMVIGLIVALSAIYLMRQGLQ